MFRKKKKDTYPKLDHSQSGASHITSDKSESFQEVSFDVLENAVEYRNSLFGYKSKNFSGKAIISSDDVLPEKKSFSIFKTGKHKEKSNVGKLAVYVLILILIFGCVAWSLKYLNDRGYFDLPQHSSELKKAIADIAKYDKSIISINEFLEKPINETTINSADIDAEDLDNVKQNLTDLTDKINDISKNLDTQSEDYLYAGYAKQTIESRIMMIDSGLKIWNSAKNSVQVITKTEWFWNSLLKADSYLKEADNLVLSNDATNYQLAKNNSEEAQKTFMEAKEQINELNKITTSYNFSVFSVYIDLKIEACQYSSLSCQALIDQNIEQIGKLNTAYIETSNKASDLALSLSTTPVQVIRTSYDLEMRPVIEEFKAARKNAADNDFALRSFIYS